MMFPFLKEAITSLFKKPSTERYPFVNKEAPEGYRGKLVFYPDKCIGCGICIKVCAASAITKTSEKVEDGEKITMKYLLNSCTFCQMCADFCPKQAIELSTQYSMVSTNKDELFVGGSFIKKTPVKPQVAPIVAKPTEVK